MKSGRDLIDPSALVLIVDDEPNNLALRLARGSQTDHCAMR
jgi:hypothetical protein